jgi:hypothetical protein
MSKSNAKLMPYTKQPIEDFQKLVQPIIGMVVSLPWKGFGTAVFFELGQLAEIETELGWRQHKNGEASIGVQWDWRVERGYEVLFGSSNSRPEMEEGILTLQDTTIEKISVAGHVPEIEVLFSNGDCLRSMVMVSGEPEWSITLPDGNLVFPSCGLLSVGQGEDTTIYTKEEEEVFALAKRTASRWGVPIVEPKLGRCKDCVWFLRIDGYGHLLDYGVCIAENSPFDGRIVMVNSGCPIFSADEEI